jgi:hypothetical protein
LLPCIHPSWVFPDPNVLLIRTHPNPSPSERNTTQEYSVAIVHVIRF